MSLLPLITLKVSLWKDHRKQREAIQYDYANTRSQKRSFYQQKVISLIPCTGRTGMRWMGRQQNLASMGVQEGISFHLISYKANVAEILTFQLNHECGLTKVKDLDILNMSRSIVINRWFMLGFSFLPSFDILWLYFKLHFSSNSSKIFVERVDFIIKKYLLRLNLFLEIIFVM